MNNLLYVSWCSQACISVEYVPDFKTAGSEAGPLALVDDAKPTQSQVFNLYHQFAKSVSELGLGISLDQHSVEFLHVSVVFLFLIPPSSSFLI